MSIESFLSGCDFYDVIHFRRGFDRAGVFTRAEADILRRCGYTIKRLGAGELVPQGSDQEAILKVLEGIAEPCSDVEKAWAKYLLAINCKVSKFSGLSNKWGGVDYSEPSDGTW